MLPILTRWYRRTFTDPQAIVLVVLLALSTGTVLLFGEILAPVIAALILAFLLDQAVDGLERIGLPRFPGVLLVFSAFVGILLLTVFWLLPLVWQQIATLFAELPSMLQKWHAALSALPQRYPTLLRDSQVQELYTFVQGEAASFGQTVLSFSLASLVNLVSILVYLFMVPFLVFFFLKDRDLLKAWLVRRLPPERRMARRVWRELRQQVGNYVRGKVVELLLTFVASYVVFAVFELRYALLLGILVGFSVLIPYVGIVAVTIPVTLVAYFQWGWSSQFGTLMLAYGIVQAMDAVVLVPLLFSEAVKLHPVAILCAILFFGGIWGFWGVFFAIPLATLVKAVMGAWSEVVSTRGTAAELDH
ncbi:MAG: AI-2E family transporter [Gammaproteobacteria bacterium]|nr:AI-2E family transporter [Gammaproteobacteria bacterium]